MGFFVFGRNAKKELIQIANIKFTLDKAEGVFLEDSEIQQIIDKESKCLTIFAKNQYLCM